MAKRKRIPADRLLFATISMLRALVLDLSKRGVIDLNDFIGTIQGSRLDHPIGKTSLVPTVEATPHCRK